MKKTAIGITAALALIGTPTFAADMVTKVPPPARPQAFSWTGCYLGGDVGGAWGHQNANTANPTGLVNQAPDFVTLNGSSAIGGAYAGCNVQLNSWVAGIEGDWSAAHISGSGAGPNDFPNGSPVGTGSINFSRDLTWIASIRGRLGFTATPTVLLYATGGAAWAGMNYSAVDAFSVCPNCSPSTFSTIPSGWVAGTGLEWAASNSWLVRIEYLHYTFSHSTSFASDEAFPGSAPIQFNFDRLNADEVRAGVSYEFGAASKY